MKKKPKPKPRTKEPKETNREAMAYTASLKAYLGDDTPKDADKHAVKLLEHSQELVAIHQEMAGLRSTCEHLRARIEALEGKHKKPSMTAMV